MKFSTAKAKLPSPVNSLLALLSAVLLTLSFPNFDWWFLAWFALVPLFFAVEREKESAINSFVLGWIFGICFFFGTCWWLTFAPVTYGGVPSVIAYALLFGVTLIVGLFPAIFSAIFSLLLKRLGTYAIFTAPFLWTATEFLRFNLTGNNWNAIGYSQAFSSYILPSASIGGVYLVGFWVSLFNSILTIILFLLYGFSKLKKSRKQSISYILTLFFRFFNFHGDTNFQPSFIEKPLNPFASKSDNNKSRKFVWRYKPSDNVRFLYIALVFSPIIFFFLFLLFQNIFGTADYSPTKSFNLFSKTYIIAVQPNVPMSGLKYGEWEKLRQRHVALAENALSKGQRTKDEGQPTIIIFPESPMNFLYESDREFQTFISDFAVKNNAFVLFNSAQPNLKGTNFYNSAVMINPNGEKVGQYDKIHLVPFGEYVPLPEPLAAVVPTMVGNFEIGDEFNLLPFGEAKGGVMICFESHFASLSREYVRNGADVLIEMTNDGYLGDTPVLRQHLANAVFRAVETNRPVLRVTNVGITAYINERGEVLDAAKPYTEDTRVWTVAKSDGSQTFYVRYGDWFAWLCSILSLALLFLSFWKRKINEQSNTKGFGA
jgi:apolipoprotein N-acyltransferase